MDSTNSKDQEKNHMNYFDEVNVARRGIMDENDLNPTEFMPWFDWDWKSAFLYEGDVSELKAPDGYKFEKVDEKTILVKETTMFLGLFPVTRELFRIIDSRGWSDDQKGIDSEDRGM